MKKLFVFSFFVVAFWLTSSTCFAKSIQMELYNVIQVNETELRFDIRIKNTTANPTTEAGRIALANVNFRVALNPAILNGGFLEKGCAYVGGTELLGTGLIPTTGNCSYITADNAFQWFNNGVDNDAVLSMLNHANWVKVGTFKAVLKHSAVTPPYLNRAFANALPNALLVTGIASGGNECLAYDDGAGNWLRGDAEFTALTCTYVNSGPNTKMYTHCFTGVGAFETAANWNVACGTGDVTKGVVPAATNTNSISIGGYSSTTFLPVTTNCNTMTMYGKSDALYIASGATFRPSPRWFKYTTLYNSGTFTQPITETSLVKEDGYAIYARGGEVLIAGDKAFTGTAKVYDVVGKEICSQKIANTNEAVLTVKGAKGVYVVRLTTETNEVITRRVLVNN